MKLSKKTKRALYINVILLYLIVSIFGVIKTTYNHIIINHNIDLTYNMCLVTNDLNNMPDINRTFNYREMNDRMSDGVTRKLTDVYHSNIFHFNFFIFGMSMFLLGYSFMMIITLSYKN